MSDEAIQLTNNDASSFKSYAVHHVSKKNYKLEVLYIYWLIYIFPLIKGYWKDPYINFFSPISSTSNLHSQVPQYPNEHKPPEMSRGYFARISSMRTVVYKFLAKYKQPNSRKSACQIVNLGAGYDTMFFNLSDAHNLPLKYVEVDFLRVVSSKIRLIKSKKALAEKVCPTETRMKDLVITDVVGSDETKSGGLFKLPTSTISSCLSSLTPGKV